MWIHTFMLTLHIHYIYTCVYGWEFIFSNRKIKTKNKKQKKIKKSEIQFTAVFNSSAGKHAHTGNQNQNANEPQNCRISGTKQVKITWMGCARRVRCIQMCVCVLMCFKVTYGVRLFSFLFFFYCVHHTFNRLGLPLHCRIILFHYNLKYVCSLRVYDFRFFFLRFL